MTRRAQVRAALRAASVKDGCASSAIPVTLAAELVEMALLRKLIERVAISGAVIGCRYKTTAQGQAWLDDDRETFSGSRFYGEEECDAS